MYSTVQYMYSTVQYMHSTEWSETTFVRDPGATYDM